jgi:all-trans-8'-apo-beta-carotenal 15,15'-oxygenase
VGLNLGAPDNATRRAMDFAHPLTPSEGPSQMAVKRYRMSFHGSLQEEIIAANGNFEFPVMNPRFVGLQQRYGYFHRNPVYELLASEIVKIDYETRLQQSFRFRDDEFISEVIFAPRTNNLAEDDGYLLTTVYDGRSKKSYVAILDAQKIEAGPVAKIHLDHHIPMRFHGAWR